MVYFILIQILIEYFVSISEETDQTPLSVASDLGMYCLHMSHEKDSWLIPGFRFRPAYGVYPEFTSTKAGTSS